MPRPFYSECNALELSLKLFDLPIVEILYLLCIKYVMGVKIKVAADSKLNDSTKTNKRASRKLDKLDLVFFAVIGAWINQF